MIDISAIGWASKVASKQILGDLEAEHGGHEAGGNPLKNISFSPHTCWQALASTLRPQNRLNKPPKIHSDDNRKSLTGCMVELWLSDSNLLISPHSV